MTNTDKIFDRISIKFDIIDRQIRDLRTEIPIQLDLLRAGMREDMIKAFKEFGK